MKTETNERISVVAGATTIGVTLTMGDVLVSIRVPRPKSTAALGEDQLRAVAVRSARRALEVALEELSPST